MTTPKRHWRSYGSDPLPTPQEALGEPLAAFGDSYIRMLSGFPVEAERMSGDKATRADAAASQCNIGRISMVRAPWNAKTVATIAVSIAAWPVVWKSSMIETAPATYDTQVVSFRPTRSSM